MLVLRGNSDIRLNPGKDIVKTRSIIGFWLETFEDEFSQGRSIFVLDVGRESRLEIIERSGEFFGVAVVEERRTSGWDEFCGVAGVQEAPDYDSEAVDVGFGGEAVGAVGVEV